MRNKRFPNFPDDADYNTNAPSYYEDLARKEKLIRLLAERIWGYEKIVDETLEEIQERFRAWDKNLDDFPEDVKILLQQWLDNGTLDHIINDTIFNRKLDTTIFENFRDVTTTQLAQTNSLKVDKGGVGQVTWAMADQNFREQVLGNVPPAVVGANSVSTANIVDKSVTNNKKTVSGSAAFIGCVGRPFNIHIEGGDTFQNVKIQK